MCPEKRSQNVYAGDVRRFIGQKYRTGINIVRASALINTMEQVYIQQIKMNLIGQRLSQKCILNCVCIVIMVLYQKKAKPHVALINAKNV